MDEQKKNTSFPVIDGRPTRQIDKPGFKIFEPMRDPSDLGKGFSHYPHLRVNENGSSHMSDLVIHNEPNSFGNGSVRMIEVSKDMVTQKESVVDKRIRVSTTGNQIIHRTQETELSPPGSVSPRTQGNTKPRFVIE